MLDIIFLYLEGNNVGYYKIMGLLNKIQSDATAIKLMFSSTVLLSSEKITKLVFLQNLILSSWTCKSKFLLFLGFFLKALRTKK